MGDKAKKKLKQWELKVENVVWTNMQNPHSYTYMSKRVSQMYRAKDVLVCEKVSDVSWL